MGQNHSTNNLRSSDALATCNHTSSDINLAGGIKSSLKKSSSVSLFDLQANDSAKIAAAQNQRKRKISEGSETIIDNFDVIEGAIEAAKN